MHLACDWIVLEDPCLRSTVGADIVCEIAAGAEDYCHAIAESGSREFCGHDVVPGGACAGKQNRRALEPFLPGEFARNFCRMTQKFANGGFVVENAFVDLDSA